MAINKNFVIKNGIEVNDNVFVVDPDINKVGINTALPDHTFHVIGGIGVTDATISGVTTALGDILVADSNGEDGKAFAVRVSAGNSVGINTANPRYPLEIIGPAQSGIIAEYVFGDLEVTGDINSSNFNGGTAIFSGITTFTNGTDNTLGNADTGAVHIDGGLGVNKNVTIGAGLSVTGTSYFVGEVTFAGGTNGDNINLGSTDADNIVFNADVNSNIIPNATSSFDLGLSSKEWRDLHLAGNAGIGSLSVSGISTFTLLTDNRIPIVGAGSTVEDDANLTFDGLRLAIGVDLDVTGNAGIGSLSVSGISTFSDNVEITSLTDNRIPIVGAGSTIEDSADLTFDGNSLAIGVALTVTGISTFNDNVSIASLTNNRIAIVGAGSTIEDDANLTFDGSALAVGVDLDVTGNTGIGSLVISGISTFSDNVEITSLTENRIPIVGAGSTIEDDANLTFNGNTLAVGVDLDVTGNAGIGSLVISGISTFSDNVEITLLTENRIPIVGAGSTIEDDANLTFDGSALAVGAALTVTGITTFTNATDNTLGNTGTGAVKIAGGLAVAKNVTVGSGLSVTGTSYFVGEVTFAGGASGNDINLGSTNDDNVVFVADVNSNIVPNNDNAYDLGSSSQQWKDLYVNGLADLDFVNVSAAATFAGITTVTGDTLFTKDLNVAGVSTFAGITTVTGDTLFTKQLSVSGVSTFVGLSTFNNGLIVHSGISTFDGRIVGAATSNVIPFLYSNFSDLPSASTYHGAFAHVHSEGKGYFAHANNWYELVNKNLDGIVGTGTEGYNVGVVTATQVDISGGDGINVSGATTTNILHVGTAGTVLSVSDQTSEFKIGSASNPVTATMNGGAIPSIGLVIALGG